MNTRLLMAFAALIVTGCSVTPHEAAPPPRTDGEPFLPAYLMMLQGTDPFPTEDPRCPPAHDLATLLIPCDTQ